jgi:hypothetical protein
MTRATLLRFVLGCTIVIALFHACFEAYTWTTSDGPLPTAAQRNPYLAAQRLLEAVGLPVTVHERLDRMNALPPTEATLLVLGQRTYMSEARAAELRDWVERGGHLVLQTWTLWNDATRRPDLLLDPLGVRQFEWSADDAESDTEPDPEPIPAPPELDEAGEDAAATTTVATAPAEWSPEPGVVLRIEFNPGFHLEHEEGPEPIEIWSDAAGDHGYSLPVGVGHITVWTDDFFLRNDAIERQDHAQLLYRLVRMFGQSGETWIVVSDDEPRSLWARILEDAWSVCIALAVLLAGYLWSIAPRFGPILPDPPPERRELMEHVRASGNFLLRQRGFDALVGGVRSALLRRLQQRHPQWTALAPRTRAERIAEHTGLAAAEIQEALDGAPCTEREKLVKRIAALERIRKRL